MLRLALCLLAVAWLVTIDSTVQADQQRAVGVRGSKLERFDDQGLTTAADVLSRAEVSGRLGSGFGAITGKSAEALQVNFSDGAFWVKRAQIRLERSADYSTGCGQRLAGVSVGSSRGIGAKCN